jgi:Rrf2 family protein
MRLSTKVRYGARILLQIALDTREISAVKGKDIARKQNISEAYLEQIMIPLKSKGLIKTVRGCNGGYALKKEAEAITVLDIIELFEGRVELVKCAEGSKMCKRKSLCVTAEVWESLSNAIRNEASKITLKELADKAAAKTAGMEYVI